MAAGAAGDAIRGLFTSTFHPLTRRFSHGRNFFGAFAQLGYDNRRRPHLADGPLAGAFVVTPGIADRNCNRGVGTQLSLPSSWPPGPPYVSASMLPTGITLVAVSPGATAPGASTAPLVYALTKSCTPDTSFGADGVEQLKLGSSGHAQQLSLAAMTPGLGGGVIVAGGFAGRWLVGRLDPNGHMDSTFGNDGWATLPWRGSASAVVQGPSGQVVVGGCTGPGCYSSSVSELSALGTLEKSFGVGGLARVASIHDGALTHVAVGHGGEVFAVSTGGNFGCWMTVVTALTPLGHPVPSFSRHFVQGLKVVDPSAASPWGVFDADLLVQPSGFALVGTEQPVCIGNTPNPSAAGRIASFAPDGQVNAKFANNGVRSFTSQMMGEVWALPTVKGGFVMVAGKPYFQTNSTKRAKLNIIAFLSDGKLDPSFGDAGRAQVLLPYLNGATSTAPLSIAGNGKTIVIVTWSTNSKALEVIQLRV